MKYSKYNSVTSLRKGLSQEAGRNAKGQITVRHRGGGHKQTFRTIDWNRSSKQSTIVGFEYDPQRSAPLAKLYNKDNTYSYILAPAGVKLFQNVFVYEKEINNNSFESSKLLQSGDSGPISFFEPGDFIHAVEAFPGQGRIFGRTAGSFCQIISFDKEKSTYAKTQEIATYATVRLPSGAKRLIDVKAQATLGAVAPSPTFNINYKKAGRTRWLGWRPTVRGVAMNPVDHPHGGGQGKTSGGRPSVTFKAWPTKGSPTRNPKRKNNFILKV